MSENEPTADAGAPQERAGMRLTFRQFSAVNRERCESPSGFNHQLGSWSTSDWFVAIIGEIGEAANVVKKLNRVRDGVPGNKETPDALRDKLRQELGDAFVYLDLIAQSLGFFIADAAVEVFDKKSIQIGYVAPAAHQERTEPHELAEIRAFYDEHAPLDAHEHKTLIQRVRDEWHDFMAVVDHCSEVYDHFSRGRISKPMTLPREVITLADDFATEDIEEAIKEAREEWEAVGAPARADESTEDEEFVFPTPPRGPSLKATMGERRERPKFYYESDETDEAARAAEWQPLRELLTKWRQMGDGLALEARGDEFLQGYGRAYSDGKSRGMRYCADQLEKLLPPGALAGDSNSKT